jgi:hypothetical protein
MDLTNATNQAGLNRTETDRNGPSKEEKLLNPTREHYGEVVALLEWLNRSFYKAELALPMVTFRTALKTFGVYVPRKWDHRSGAMRPEFRLNPVLFKEAAFETKCLELLRLMEHLRQAKASRTNYHDRDYADGMKEHGLQTHRDDAPHKKTGERITLSVIPGGKFEKLVAKKGESFAFSWAVRGEKKPEPDGKEKGEKADAKSGRKFKYECPVEGCPTAFWGKDGQQGGCFLHDPPVRLKQID